MSPRCSIVVKPPLLLPLPLVVMLCPLVCAAAPSPSPLPVTLPPSACCACCQAWCSRSMPSTAARSFAGTSRNRWWRSSKLPFSCLSCVRLVFVGGFWVVSLLEERVPDGRLCALHTRLPLPRLFSLQIAASHRSSRLAVRTLSAYWMSAITANEKIGEGGDIMRSVLWMQRCGEPSATANGDHNSVCGLRWDWGEAFTWKRKSLI